MHIGLEQFCKCEQKHQMRKKEPMNGDHGDQPALIIGGD